MKVLPRYSVVHLYPESEIQAWGVVVVAVWVLAEDVHFAIVLLGWLYLGSVLAVHGES